MTNLSLITRKTIQEQFRVDVSKIPVENALRMGSDNAAQKIIVFTNPDCPYCAKLHQTIRQIITKRNDSAFLIKILPLHKDTYAKAKSIVCSRSLKMLEDGFENKEIPRTDCQTDELEKNRLFAESLDLLSTPTMIFPDGSVIVGAIPEDELLKKLDSKK